MRIKACPQIGHIKANSEGRTIFGYASIFGNVDSYGDRVVKGAFKKTIRERGPKGSNQVKFLWNHNPMEIPVGVITELKEDDIGLYYEARILRTPKGDELLEAVREGAINRNSFGYSIIKAKTAEAEDFNGEEVQDLHELKLYEISPVNWPANEDATLMGAKSVESQLLDLLSKANPQNIAEMLTTKALDERVVDAITSREEFMAGVMKSVMEAVSISRENTAVVEEEDPPEEIAIEEDSLQESENADIVTTEIESAEETAPATAGWEDVQAQLAEILKTVQALAATENPPAPAAEETVEATSPDAGVDPDIVQSLTAEIESLFDLD